MGHLTLIYSDFSDPLYTKPDVQFLVGKHAYNWDEHQNMLTDNSIKLLTVWIMLVPANLHLQYTYILKPLNY